jgi:hypothetical protein
MGEPEDVAKIFQDLLKLEDKIDRDRDNLCHAFEWSLPDKA